MARSAPIDVGSGEPAMTPEEYLRRALRLAEQARGRTSPNPLVGCVIVRDGDIVGEGYHAGCGLAHAERVALEAAGERARGATLYCTLEPCGHHGRTPPCTEAIIAAGIATVVYGVDDPDPQVAGSGAAQLRAAGIEVRAGLCREEVERQLAAYLHHRRTGRPLVTAKWAMTLDGKLATATGDSHWVSGTAARRYVHELRDRVDAVMVGIGTVLADDPSLTCRLAEFGPIERPSRHPLRVVVDTHARCPDHAKVRADGLAPTIWAVGEGAAAVATEDVEVLRLPLRDDRIDLAALLEALGARGIVDLLCEAGGGLTGALFAAGLVDRVVAIVAPKLVGAGPTVWDARGRATMAEAVTLREIEVTRLDEDVILQGAVETAARCSPESSRRSARSSDARRGSTS